MPVLYDSKKIIPVSFCTIVPRTQRAYDGRVLSRTFTITLEGALSAHKGSPDHNGDFWTGSGYPADTPAESLSTDKRLAVFRQKLGALQNLFHTEGKWLEIAPFDGSATIKCQPRFLEMQFDKGVWHDKVPWTATFEADVVYYGDIAVGQTSLEIEESWSLEPADEIGRSYRLSHQLAASGRRRYLSNGVLDKEGWQVARELVLTKLGLESDKLQAEGVLNLSSHQGYNHVRTEQIDEAAGKFSVTETWLCFNPADHHPDVSDCPAIEELRVEVRKADAGSQDRYWYVSLQGTITGLEERHPETRALIRSRYTNARTRLDNIRNNPSIPLGRAQSYAGVSLNPLPRNRTFSENVESGVITYSYEYTSSPLDPTRVITISTDFQADVFASIGVLNRPAGPILQGLNSRTHRAVTVNAEILVESHYGDPPPSKPSFNPWDEASSVVGSYTKLFVAQDRDNWDKTQGRYSRTTTFVWE